MIFCEVLNIAVMFLLYMIFVLFVLYVMIRLCLIVFKYPKKTFKFDGKEYSYDEYFISLDDKNDWKVEKILEKKILDNCI